MSSPYMFRDLRADEIECRIAQIKPTGVTLLLYKDARCDQNILDETVGAMNWQRSHLRDNANCIVSIWDESKQQWVSKEDTGTESNTEKEKGLASDSFKRACFNWGIGRELYTAPFIFIKAKDCKITQGNGHSLKCYDRFDVGSITIENKRIVSLTIINKETGRQCYPEIKTGEQPSDAANSLSQIAAYKELANQYGKEAVTNARKHLYNEGNLLMGKTPSELTKDEFRAYMSALQRFLNHDIACAV